MPIKVIFTHILVLFFNAPNLLLAQDLGEIKQRVRERAKILTIL